ncbi:MAG TPA: prolipoprotein diacylglyceryl transferase [Chryseolinea sp.]
MLPAPFVTPAFIHWNPSPTLFDLGFFSLRWYGMLFALGFVLSYQILQHYFKKEKVVPGLLDSLTIYVVLAAVIGARLGHCLFYDFDYYADHILEIFLPVKFQPQFEFIGFQGLASHGGAFGILIAITIFCIRKNISFFWVLDKLALVIPLAGCCIRLGNLMNSEILGKPSTVPWAFIFEQEDPQPRHPAQLYEALSYLLIFVALHFLNRGLNRRPGFIFGIFLVLLFATRFLLEFLKENQSPFESDLTFNMGQLLSIPFILFGLILAILKRGPENILNKQG